MQNKGVDVQGLRKIYSNTEGVAGGIHEASFQLPAGTFFTLLGPSGCGKTTTLRCIAGLEKPDAGVIRVGDDLFFDGSRNISIPLNHRRIGMVFQSYAVWPHMTVFENVSFPLRVAKDRKYSREEIGSMTRKALTVVDLEAFADRSATRLSGGQQQRVALARAIVREPELLLLDEPLSNLDAALRDSMRAELKRLQRRIGVTTIYVTHDQAEALDMSDQIAVINQGQVVQIASPEELYFRPCNAFVASFIGNTNLLTASVEDTVAEGATATARLASGDALRCLATRPVTAGEAVSISIRPESISLVHEADANQPARNRFAGQVEAVGFVGNMKRFDIQAAGCRITVNTHPRVGLSAGDSAILDFAIDDAIVLGE